MSRAPQGRVGDSEGTVRLVGVYRTNPYTGRLTEQQLAERRLAGGEPVPRMSGKGRLPLLRSWPLAGYSSGERRRPRAPQCGAQSAACRPGMRRRSPEDRRPVEGLPAISAEFEPLSFAAPGVECSPGSPGLDLRLSQTLEDSASSVSNDIPLVCDNTRPTKGLPGVGLDGARLPKDSGWTLEVSAAKLGAVGRRRPLGAKRN